MCALQVLVFVYSFALVQFWLCHNNLEILQYSWLPLNGFATVIATSVAYAKCIVWNHKSDLSLPQPQDDLKTDTMTSDNFLAPLKKKGVL